MTTHERYELLIQRIEEAGALARDYFDSDDFSNEQKSDGSVVTKIDQGIERVIRTFIDEYFPDDAVVGEEEENKAGTSGYVWHIDPIDGTDNFLRKIPFCAISIARLGDDPEGTFAIVHNPITRHTFSSVNESGAYENQRLVATSAEPLGGNYFITVDRGREPWMYPASFHLMTGLSKRFGRSKNLGSAALNVAYVAAGRFDGMLTFGLNTYDYAAGLYLVRAAGGAISVYEAGEWRLWEGTIKELCDVHGKTIFASHPDVHERIRDFIGNPRAWEAGVLE
jgi:myo-inositol-1(or 4)-monophosphatase